MTDQTLYKPSIVGLFKIKEHTTTYVDSDILPSLLLVEDVISPNVSPIIILKTDFNEPAALAEFYALGGGLKFKDSPWMPCHMSWLGISSFKTCPSSSHHKIELYYDKEDIAEAISKWYESFK